MKEFPALLTVMLRIFPILLFSVLLAPGAEPTNFIRVEKAEKSTRLQTSITKYQKGSTTVTLIGAIHIGDQTYFEALNEEFTNYPVVLFELIGGENKENLPNGTPRPREQADGRPVSGLRGLYSSFAHTMQLAEQLSHIDYTKDNFIHADLTTAEYAELSKGNSGELLAFALENGVKTSEITGKAFGGIDMGLVMRAILSGDGQLLKLEYMTMMEQGDESAAAITGQNLIISDRNEKCFQVLARQLSNGAQDLAIFYGAAHFPDMERRLLADGYTRSEHRWLTAWDVPK